MEKLKISNGRVTVEKPGEKPSIYEGVSLVAGNISYESPIPFTAEAKTPGGGKLKVEGTAGPINQTDAALTPLQAQVSIDKDDPASTGFIDPASGIAGLLAYKGTAQVRRPHRACGRSGDGRQAARGAGRVAGQAGGQLKLRLRLRP